MEQGKEVSAPVIRAGRALVSKELFDQALQSPEYQEHAEDDAHVGLRVAFKLDSSYRVTETVLLKARGIVVVTLEGPGLPDVESGGVLPLVEWMITVRYAKPFDVSSAACYQHEFRVCE